MRMLKLTKQKNCQIKLSNSNFVCKIFLTKKSLKSLISNAIIYLGRKEGSCVPSFFSFFSQTFNKIIHIHTNMCQVIFLY